MNKFAAMALPFVDGEHEVSSQSADGTYLHPMYFSKNIPDQFQIVTAGRELTKEMIDSVNADFLGESTLSVDDPEDKRIYRSYVFRVK